MLLDYLLIMNETHIEWKSEYADDLFTNINVSLDENWDVKMMVILKMASH